MENLNVHIARVARQSVEHQLLHEVLRAPVLHALNAGDARTARAILERNYWLTLEAEVCRLVELTERANEVNHALDAAERLLDDSGDEDDAPLLRCDACGAVSEPGETDEARMHTHTCPHRGRAL